MGIFYIIYSFYLDSVIHVKKKDIWHSKDHNLIRISSLHPFSDMLPYKDLMKLCKGSHSDDLYSSNQITEQMKSDFVAIFYLDPFASTERALHVPNKCIMGKCKPVLNWIIVHVAPWSEEKFLRFKQVVKKFYF